ncbi:MAG: rRNA maturation RNase YbeY [Acidimicrobiia bacterium]
MAEVFFADEQNTETVDGARIAALAGFVLDAESVTDRAEVSILAVDEPTIADLNSRFLKRAGPTDVLAFPIEDAPWQVASDDSGADAPVLLGDVVLCPGVARRNAPSHAGTFEGEIDLLVVHGLLHLLGYDHNSDADAERMEGRERRLLARFATRRAGSPK